MNIILPKYATYYDLMPIKTQQEADEFGFRISYDNKQHPGLDNYVLYWGTQSIKYQYGTRYGVMESAPFYRSMFIDTVGNYQSAALNTAIANKMVREFELNGRKSAVDIVFSMKSGNQSKFNPTAGNKSINWDKIVLALQNPGDRSIQAVTSANSYYRFVEECCKFYGKNLFLKIHPWNRKPKDDDSEPEKKPYNILVGIANKYGCEYGHTSVDIIKNCEFVIAFNSTFAIDCLLRDVIYVQYAMGTFFSAYGVVYSHGSFPHKVEKIENAKNLCDFLVYKYCYSREMGKSQFVDMVRHFSTSKEMFPMNDEFCYANNLKENWLKS